MSAEERRSQRHHDVLCLVLKELVRWTERQMPGEDWTASGPNEAVQLAREFADIAYPPPKAEGT